MPSIAIITDSDSSPPAEAAARYGIRHGCGTGGRCPSPPAWQEAFETDVDIASVGREEIIGKKIVPVEITSHERRGADDDAYTS